MWWIRLVALLAALAASLCWLIFLVSLAPESSSDRLRFPSDLSELRELSAVATSFASDSPTYTILLFSSAYLFKQAFAVPGSVFLNALAGAIFGLPVGLVLCSLLTAFGASSCYLMARFCGANAAETFFPERISDFRRRLHDNEDRLGYFLVALRLFPVSPNWAINMSCGVLGVPLRMFFPTVLVGLLPYNYLCVQAGAVLATIDSLSDVFSWSIMAQMAAMAVVATLPGVLMKRNGHV